MLVASHRAKIKIQNSSELRRFVDSQNLRNEKKLAIVPEKLYSTQISSLLKFRIPKLFLINHELEIIHLNERLSPTQNESRINFNNLRSQI